MNLYRWESGSYQMWWRLRWWMNDTHPVKNGKETAFRTGAVPRLP
ncbi:hypothetical protein ACNKHU_18330 [Shigella flexneri]